MELQVSGADLKSVLKSSRFGKKLGKVNIRHETVDFSFDGKVLCISVVGVESTIPATGTWKGMISLPLANWAVLQKVPPSAEIVVLKYEPGTTKIFVGTTGFKAEHRDA